MGFTDSANAPHFDVSMLRKIERLLRVVGGEALGREMIDVERQKTKAHIVESISRCAEEKDSELNYLHTLKSIDVLENEKENESENEIESVWSRYGLRYRISMDLDFAETVTANAHFDSAMRKELSSVLGVDASLVLSACAVSLTLILFQCKEWAREKMSFLIQRKGQNGKGGEELKVGVGDEVTVDYDGKQYAATVRSLMENAQGRSLTVEYVGRPFFFRNTETLPRNSPRLHFAEPGGAYLATLYPDEGGQVSFQVMPVEL